MLRGGDGGISFSKRSQHVDGQLLLAAVTLGPFTTTLRTHLGCCQPSLPASMSACPYLLPSSTETRIPYGFFGWPSGHLLRCSLNGVLPQTQGIPCLTGLNPRALDPQTSAAWPRMASNIHFSLKTRIQHLDVLRWTDPNGGQNGGQTHSQAKRRGLITCS